MSDFEMLSIMLMILGIIVTLLIAYVIKQRSDRPQVGHFFVSQTNWN